MHTKDILANELNRIGLHEMAVRARAGYYHDYLSEIAAPCVQLAVDLRAAAQATTEANRIVLIMDVLERHLNGEFDATIEESDAWADSPDGQEAFRRLRTGT